VIDVGQVADPGHRMGELADRYERFTGQNTLQPVNAATKREYRGVNVLMLWAAAEITGYQDGRWASFRQWQQIGAQVRRGEKGTPVVFYKELQRRGGDAASGGPISGQFEGAAAEATKPGTYLMAKTSYVFNAAQVEGDTPPQRPELPGLAVRLESAERFVAATGAVIVHGGDRAYYQLAEDRIQLPPPEQFRSSEGYYATALHELTHWSGHKSRLDRNLTGRYRCAGLRLRDGGLCRRRAGGGDRGGLPVRQGRGDSRAPGGLRPLPQQLDRRPEGRQPGDLHRRQSGPEGGGLPDGVAAAMIHGQDRAR
jgi:hypothetical protein